MKENKTARLNRLFKTKITGVPCEIKYNPRYGWMCFIEGGSWQIIGYNYKQAKEFINKFDWGLLLEAKPKEAL